MTAHAASGGSSRADRALAFARETFAIEAAAVLGLKTRVGEGFAQTVERILAIEGRVVVMGMGKSGHVGRKIAATLASTGTPALFDYGIRRKNHEGSEVLVNSSYSRINELLDLSEAKHDKL